MGLSSSYSSNSNVRSQVYSNSFIFKENLKLIAKTLIETIWRDKISSPYLDSAIQDVKDDVNRGDLDLIKEKDEEMLSSIYFSKVENINDSNQPSDKKPKRISGKSKIEEIVKNFQREKLKQNDIKTKLKSICHKRPSFRGEMKFKESLKLERKTKAKSSLKNKTPRMRMSRKYKSIKNQKEHGNITDLYDTSSKPHKPQREKKLPFYNSERKIKQITSKDLNKNSNHTLDSEKRYSDFFKNKNTVEEQSSERLLRRYSNRNINLIGKGTRLFTRLNAE